MLRQNPDADLPGCYADDEGENDRRLITSGHQTGPLNRATDCQIEFLLMTDYRFDGTIHRRVGGDSASHVQPHSPTYPCIKILPLFLLFPCSATERPRMGLSSNNFPAAAELRSRLWQKPCSARSGPQTTRRATIYFELFIPGE